MDYGDRNDDITQSVFRSHEYILKTWECSKVISIIHDVEVVSIIKYEIKVVYEQFFSIVSINRNLMGDFAMGGLLTIQFC